VLDGRGQRLDRLELEDLGELLRERVGALERSSTGPVSLGWSAARMTL
jgi:hypothetical protein